MQLSSFRRPETRTLIVLLLIAVAIWAFAALASEMVDGELDSYDRAILLALRNPADATDPLGPAVLEQAMRDFTGLGGVAVLTLLTLATALALMLRAQTRLVVALLVAVAGGGLLSMFAKMLFGRARPDLVPHGVDVYTASFPSGHSMMSAATYLTLAAMLARAEPMRRIKAYYFTMAVFVTVLVGFSRVYLGVHWPSDVLAGWTAGAAWALSVDMVSRSLMREDRVPAISGEPERLHSS